MEHIKERIADFGAFREGVGMNEIICNNIQTSISFCKEDLETVMEKNENLCSSETKSYYWLSFDGLKNIISNNSYEHLESEIIIIEKKKACLIDNKQRLCEQGGLNPMI